MRILAVMHHAESCPGLIGDILRAAGAEIDVRRPRFGDPLPTTMDEHEAAIFFGGDMSVNDADDWIKAEIDWLGVALEADVPFLGICLGAQMLARRLGARVCRHPEGAVEVGFNAVRTTPEGMSCFGEPLPERVCHWHREGFDLPEGAVLLASNDTFAVQAFRYGKAYGLQYHPEVTDRILGRWLASGQDGLSVPCEKARREHLARLVRHQPTVRAWLDTFLSRWLLPVAGMAKA